MRINSNEILLVNRGWIEKNFKNKKEINSTNINIYEGIIKKLQN